MAVAVLINLSAVNGQMSSASISLGAGLPELISLRLGVNFGQVMVGVNVGTIPVKDEKLFALGLNAGIHFAGSSKHTEIKPWYSAVGFNYLSNETVYIREKYTYLSLRAGHEFNFSPKAALAIDGGVMFETSYSNEELQAGNSWDHFYGGTWPALGFRFIFRL